MSLLVRSLALALLAGLVSAQAAAQPVMPSNEEGRMLFARQILWTDYEANPQNWAIAQRPNGLIYIANTQGVLEYDGSEWRTIDLPSSVRPLVRSLAVGAKGKLYVGGSGTLGVLVPDSTSTLTYRPLDAYVPEGQRGFSDVWSTHTTPLGVVFQTPEQLMRWNGRRMEVWTTPTRFRSAFLIKQTAYVWEEGIGIKSLGRDGLQLIVGGGDFADRKVDALLEHEGGMVAIVRDEGLVRVSAGGATPITGSGSEYLKSFRPYAAVRVTNAYQSGIDLYAVSTFGGGVALIDGRGRLVRVYREDIGLTEGSQATGISTDAQGGLWIGRMNGLARIDLFPRHSWFDEETGLLGSGYGVLRTASDLYATTASGLFRLVPGQLGRTGTANPVYSYFERVEGIPESSVWGITITPGGLLVGTSVGLFVKEAGRAPRLLTRVLTFSMTHLRARPELAVVGEKTGAILLRSRNGRWEVQGPIEGVSGEIRSIVETANGDVWLSDPAGRIFRVTIDASGQATAKEFGLEAGLEVSGSLSTHDGQLRMAAQDGVFRVHAQGDTLVFEREPGFAGLGGIYTLFQGANTSNAWLSSEGHLRPLALPGVPLGPAAFELGDLQAADVFEEDNGVVWVATADGLLRYDSRVPLGARTYPAFVRRVTDRQRRTLYGGAETGTADGMPQLIVDYADQNEIRFEFSAAFYDRPTGIEYQTRLDGGFDEWSPWGSERSAAFSNLREGTYTFRVRARDDQGRISEEAAFILRVLPPWYRTLWAYAAYFMIAGCLIWALTAWRLHKHRLKMEAQRAHGARLERLSTRLRETNSRLREADKLKDDLLSNTSHELRTPLTAILGFSEMLLMEIDEEQRDLAEGIQRGGKRLLDTVNGLLDMFKLQSGTLTLSPAEIDAAHVARECVRRVTSVAESAGLQLNVRPESSALMAHLDSDAFGRILSNLLDNAIKFTETGDVTVILDGDDKSLYLTVKDTGIGIPAVDVERVFRPFEQASSGYARSHEGTGLGLSIVERVTELLGGFVTLESREGEGTTVRVTLPRWADLNENVGSPSTVITDVSLAGLHLLAVGFDERLLGSVASWIEPDGHVHAVATPALAVRDARKLAYDVVAMPAADPEDEERAVRQIRNTPGYADLPILRLGGEPVDETLLAERGFTHQVPTPVDARAFVGLLGALLMHVTVPSDA